jgi:hypothetical protein
MIQPTSPFSMHKFNRACLYAGLGTFTTATLTTYVHLPLCVLNLPCDRWVDVNVWSTGTGVEITRSIYLMLGNRPPTVSPLPKDDTSPTRAIFLTLTHDLRYEDIQWPGGIPPLLFYSVKSVQQVNHVHAAMVFNYFSTSPGTLCTALGLGGNVRCTRIKLSWAKVVKYMADQAYETLSYVINRQEACAFRDYRRMATRQEAVNMEDASLGAPFVIDGHTPRNREWRWRGVHGNVAGAADVQHVDTREMHKSSVPGRVDRDYKGEAVVFMPVSNDIVLPTRVTFAVPYKI